MGIIYTRKADGSLEQARTIRVIGAAGLDSRIEQFAQENEVVTDFVGRALSTYPTGDTSIVEEYADYITATGYDRPVGYPMSATSGLLYVQNEKSGFGYTLSAGTSDIESHIYNAVPNEVHQYLVKDADGKLLENRRIMPDGSVRMIRFNGYVRNCRDLGGWSCNGGKVKYGKLFRSAVVATSEAIDKQIAESLGIRHHIDFRNDEEASYIAESPLGSAVRYNRFTLNDYYANSVRIGGSDFANLKKVFRTIMDAAIHNEGVIYNCSLGRDRTGTVTLLLLALLGVDEVNIDIDYELSSFSYENKNLDKYAKRTNADYKALKTYLASLGGASLESHAVWWFIRAGFTLNELNAFRRAMTDGTPAELTEDEFALLYTNQIPISTDVDGNIFNGIGYIKGYRINSSGDTEVSETSYSTGFIPCKSGDVVRFSGMNLETTSSGTMAMRVVFYDSSRNLVKATSWSTLVSDGNAVATGGIIEQITVPSYSEGTVAYFRCSSYWIDNNSIITVNQEIA